MGSSALSKVIARGRRGLVLAGKGIRSLREMGIRATWHRVVTHHRLQDAARTIACQPLLSEEELAAQRAHVFPRPLSFSVVVPLYNTPEPFLRAMIDSVIGQTYANWELCMADGSDSDHPEVERICREYASRDSRIRYSRLPENRGISGNTNACVEMTTGDYIGLFDHDDLLHPAALFEVATAICETDADFVYTDEAKIHDTPADAYDPHFKPDFAPDNLRANNYICHFTVFKRSLLAEVGLFDSACDGSQDHDMVLRLTEKAQRIAHIPEILYYWRAHAGSVAESAGVKSYAVDAGVRAIQRCVARMGMEGEVAPVREGLTIHRTRYAIDGTPKVSILIPNHDHVDDLRTCLDSIFGKTTYPNIEVVVVENGSSDPALFAYYGQIQRERPEVRVVTWLDGGPFNYSALNNFGAQYCTGEYLLLLNNDTEVISPDWIQEMLMFAQRADVGAVGAKLLYPDGTIQHAGVVLGLGGVAGHAFHHENSSILGYMGKMLYAQNMAAVTGACMMVPRAIWDEVGGLNEEFAVSWNDVDLCLHIRQAGYLVVWTPFAELYHYESKTRDPSVDNPEFKASVRLFEAEWGDALDAGDPYYNPNFLLTQPNYPIDPVAKKHHARLGWPR